MNEQVLSSVSECTESPDLKNLHNHVDNIKTEYTDRDVLEGLEAAIQPHIYGGADGSDLTVEGICNDQEVVWPNREELPVICPRCGQSLVNLKELNGGNTVLSKRQRDKETIREGKI